MLPDAEREKRLRAVASSEGSLAMEGQSLDSATRELNRQDVAGELTFEQFSIAIDQHAKQLARSFEEQTLAISAYR